jgi:hypothetical protein
MNPHSLVRTLVLAASALSPIIAAKIAQTVSQIAAHGYAAFLQGKPLPMLTDILLINFAGSKASLGLALGLTIAIFLGAATIANPKAKSTESITTAQVALAFVGPFLSLLYLGSVLISAVLPLVTLKAP